MELFRQGNKPGKMLANLAKGRRGISHITALNDKTGITRTDPTHINSILQDFYQTLYTAHTGPTVLDKGQDFLQRVTFLVISTNQGDLLNADITETKIQTICNLGSGKAPGPDGFSGKF